MESIHATSLPGSLGAIHLPRYSSHSFPVLSAVLPPIMTFSLDSTGSTSSPSTVGSVSPKTPSRSSTQSPGNISQLSLNEFALESHFKRNFAAYKDDSDDGSVDPFLQIKRPRFIKLQPDQGIPSTSIKREPLDLLGLISLKGSNDSSLSKFLMSGKTYSLCKSMSAATMNRLIDTVYGGRVVVSRKRKSFGSLEDKLSDDDTYASIQSSSPSLKQNCLPLKKNRKRKLPQGRPVSSEMSVEVIFPQTLDDLHSILCVRGSQPVSHRVKLENSEASEEKEEGCMPSRPNSTKPLISHQTQYPKLDQHGNPIFSNSLDMIRYFTGASEFSIATPFRQSSEDKSMFKKGTCPVIKFCITPVTDYSLDFLKSMAFPRYKAGMKFYIIPHQRSGTGAVFTPAPQTFYTSAALFLQDQLDRIQQGLELDYKSRIFHNSAYPDIPDIIYDRELYQRGPDTKADLNYILN